MRKTVLAAAAAFAVASGATATQTSAADLDFMPPPPVFQPTWAGFYVGGHLGYGETKFDFRQNVDIFTEADLLVVPPSLNTFRGSVSPDGLVGGIQAGYNWQVNSLVFGIEGDISFTDWGQSTVLFDTDAGDMGGPFEEGFARGTSKGDVDFLASIRGRVGYAFDSVLLYGTGGIAWADAEARAHIVAVEDQIVLAEATGKKSLNDVGFVAGGGLAWMVIPETVSVGVEGLYYWFKEKKTLIDETVDIDGTTIDLFAKAELHDTWVVWARADFHF
jgi:outer membrane immunogenic protein